jgi:hypothetical protein
MPLGKNKLNLETPLEKLVSRAPAPQEKFLWKKAS